MRMSFPYLILRGASYSYRRPVPSDLRQFYPGNPDKRYCIVQALKTRDRHVATIKGEALNKTIERLWADLRDPEKTIYAQGALNLKPTLSEAELFAEGQRAAMLWNLDRYEREQYRKAQPEPVEVEDAHTLTDALALYLKLHENGTHPTFIKTMGRSISLVTDILGDKPLADYSRQDARKVADKLALTMKSKSLRTYLSRICAIVNRGLTEWQLSCTNPFAKIDIKHEGRDAKKVETFSADELALIADACWTTDDEVAWISAMQMATGARVQEISRLRVDDVILDHAIPHIKIREHYGLERTIKTDASERDVPILGLGFWAAQHALMQSSGHSGWLFHTGELNKNEGANKVNRWLKKLGFSKASHSFRHTVIDQLRDNIEIPEKLAERIVGHAKGSMHDQYGAGYSLERLRDALQTIAPAVPAATPSH
jgi:integrase